MKNITKATVEDLHDILSLQKAAFTQVAGQIGNFDIPPLRQTYDQLHKEYFDLTILKYEIDGRIAGSVRAYSDEENICHVGKLIVHPDHQNQGIGRSLMLEIERHFPGCSKFVLFTGEDTPNTSYLYGKIGYNIVGRKKQGGVDMIYMEKDNKQH